MATWAEKLASSFTSFVTHLVSQMLNDDIKNSIRLDYCAFFDHLTSIEYTTRSIVEMRKRKGTTFQINSKFTFLNVEFFPNYNFSSFKCFCHSFMHTISYMLHKNFLSLSLSRLEIFLFFLPVSFYRGGRGDVCMCVCALFNAFVRWFSEIWMYETIKSTSYKCECVSSENITSLMLPSQENMRI